MVMTRSVTLEDVKHILTAVLGQNIEGKIEREQKRSCFDTIHDLVICVLGISMTSITLYLKRSLLHLSIGK